MLAVPPLFSFPVVDAVPSVCKEGLLVILPLVAVPVVTESPVEGQFPVGATNCPK
jgi:hypothetical protein